MQQLKSLKEAAIAAHHLLISFKFLESKNPQLVKTIEIVRNILPPCESLATNKDTATVQVQDVNEVQLEVQALQKKFTEIRGILSIEPKVAGDVPARENRFYVTCITHIKSIINLVIDNCSGMNGAIHQAESSCSSVASSSKSAGASSSLKRKIISAETESQLPLPVMETEEDQNDGGCISKKTKKPKPPLEEALDNDVVLLEIFRYTSTTDLKNFRLVNHKWNETATSTLLIKKSVYLVFGVHDEKECHPNLSEAPRPIENWACKIGTVKDLCHVIQNSPKFPTKSILFLNGCPEKDPAVVDLFKLFGNEVKEITFVYSSKVSIHFLRQLLVTYAPNLETLVADGCILLEEEKEEESESTLIPISTLPNLKNFNFEPYWEGDFNLEDTDSDYRLHFEFFQEILRAATHLQSIQTCAFDFLEEVLKMNKVEVIKDFQYVPTTEKRYEEAEEDNNIGVYEKLASMCPKIAKLTVSLATGYPVIMDNSHNKALAERTLNSLLESSKDSLKSLQINPLGGFLVTFPQLPRLKQLIVCDDGLSNAVDVFPSSPAFTFSPSFPNLSTVELLLNSYAESTIISYFPRQLRKDISSTNSVKYLRLGGDIFNPEVRVVDSQFEGAGLLASMFPNVISLEIVYPDSGLRSHYLNPILWHLCPPKLKYLTIHGLLCSAASAQDDNEFIGEMAMGMMWKPVDVVDSFFTGIQGETCKKLRQWPHVIGKGQIDESLLDVLRTQRSICDLTNLEELNLICNNFRSGDPFASHVTGLYAFDVMPSLKVTVTYDPDTDDNNCDAQVSGKVVQPNSTPLEDMEKGLQLISSYVRSVCKRRSY